MAREDSAAAALGVVGADDQRAVLGAAIVALAHALSGVVALPEQLQHLPRSWWPGVSNATSTTSAWPVRPLQTSS